MLGQRMYAGQKPNIILIVADDLGYGDLGSYGQQKIQTPHIDALAKSGLSFTQFYAGTTVCAPSRASLMTGLHTGHTAVRGNRGFKPEGQFPLPEDAVTLPQLLQEQGYTTAAFGKWGLGYPGSTGMPDKQGFQEFYGYLCQSLAHNYYPDHLWLNGIKINIPQNLTGDSIYSADHIHRQALAYLAQPKEQPYFLFLPYTLPHGDLDVPRDSVYQHYVKLFNEPPVERVANSKPNDRYEPHPHAAYAAMVARLDAYIRQIRQQVKSMGQEENTLIIFTSDNGPHREDGGDPEFFNSSGIFRGIKRDLYEGGIRVPMIASWKNTITAGTKTDHVAAFWDFLPTFLDLSGIKPSGDFDGISFAPTMLHSGKQSKHPFLYWEFHENNGRQAVRMGKWKGVVYNASLANPNPMELYDLEKDPGETNNVAGRNGRLVAELMSIMQREHRYNKEWPLLFKEKESSQRP